MTESTTDKTYRKTMLQLPAQVHSEFIRLKNGGTENAGTRNGYIAALRRAGWTLQSVSAASGLTRERVRQIVGTFVGKELPALPGLYVPEPPVRAQKTPRVFVEPDPAKLAEAASLQTAAQSVRSNSEKYREEAERYTFLIADMHLNDGVPLYRLAKRLGVSHGALRFRLVRYGYMTPKNGGSSKVYDAIISENRAID